MFGTLVVNLPSPHRGGDLRITHQSLEKVFSTAKTRHSFAAWYGDVTHEVLPVESGYRWVLTHNLAVDPATTTPPAALQTTHPSFVKLYDNSPALYSSTHAYVLQARP